MHIYVIFIYVCICQNFYFCSIVLEVESLL